MDAASVAEDEPALLTLELILLDLTWIRLPKVDQDQLIIPTLCFKVLDFPLVTFSPQQEPTNSKANLVIYNQGKSCIFHTGLQSLSEQFRTYPVYSFLMDTGSQPAPMVAFGSFPLQAVLEDISRFTQDGGADWPTVSAQHGQAYLRSTRGKRVALINFALRLSCLSDGGGALSGATGEPAAAVSTQRFPGAAGRGEPETAEATAAPWPQWHIPPPGADSATGGHRAAEVASERSLSFESAREVRVVRGTERRHLHRPAAAAESAESTQELRVVRLTGQPSAGAALTRDRHVAWGLHHHHQHQQQQQRWDGHLFDGEHLSDAPPPPPLAHTLLEDASADEEQGPAAPPPMGRPRSARGSRGAAAARSRSSSAERAEPGGGGGGGSCWRAPLETDEGSLASDASSGPIVSRLIQELAAMQRATAESRHVAVQTRPLRELQPRGPPPPPPPIAPIRGAGRRRARAPPLRRLPLISEEPVTEGFARRRAAGPRPLHRPPAPPDTTAVDRLSRGQPVIERRPGAARLRVPPPRLRPVTLTRTAQLRLARHMADVRHDLHAQEYGRRRDRWLTEQRRRLGGNSRPRAPLPSPPPPPEGLPQPPETSPPSGRSGPARKRRGRGPPRPPPAAAVMSVGVQFESDGSPPVAERGGGKAAAAGAAGRQSSPPSSFVEPRLAASSPPSRSAQSRSVSGDRRSPPGGNARRAVKTPPDFLDSTGGTSHLSGDTSAESPSAERSLSGAHAAARHSQSATTARPQPRSPSETPAVRSRSETISRSAAGRQVSSAASPAYSEPIEPDSSLVRSSVSGERRRRSLVSADGGEAAIPGSGGEVGASGSGGDRAAVAGAAGRRSSVESATLSTLRTDRHVPEEMVSAARRSPPGAADTVKTETASSRRSSHRTATPSSIATESAPTQSASASQVEERISAARTSSSSSSEEEDSSASESSDSSSTLTEQTRTQTQASDTQPSSSSERRAPAAARRSGKSPTSGRPNPGSGARASPKPAPRGPPTWQRVPDPADAEPTKPAARAGTSGPAATVSPSRSRPAAPTRRSRSTSRDSDEIDARIAMFLKQSGEKQQQEEKEREQRRRREEEAAAAAAAAAAPVGGGWLKGAAPAAAAAAAVGGGGASWLKAWRVDEDGAPPAGTAGRRASRGRHTLSQQPTIADQLNTDSVSSYAPSDMDGGTLSDLTPP